MALAVPLPPPGSPPSRAREGGPGGGDPNPAAYRAHQGLCSSVAAWLRSKRWMSTAGAVPAAPGGGGRHNALHAGVALGGGLEASSMTS